jgi:hypothetical protein
MVVIIECFLISMFRQAFSKLQGQSTPLDNLKFSLLMSQGKEEISQME